MRDHLAPLPAVPEQPTSEAPRAAGVGSRRLLLGVAALFSGAALLANILGGVPLPLTVLLGGLAFVAVVVAIVFSAPARGRPELVRLLAAGAAGGLLATLAYDVARIGLSQLDPAPWSPVEAIRRFGLLLVGETSASAAVWAAGIAFHLLNGTLFGVAFTLFVGGIAARGALVAILAGAGWGLFLELFQLALYPGWLSIQFVDEFRQVSFLAHIVYGAVLGGIVGAVLRRRPAHGP